uniref:Anaphase-promoting complex subunit 4 WD40 domain-containing protein n=1 Tax=Setaria digitata TaxID=48799 RepID=A0A915PU53_9BILA
MVERIAKSEATAMLHYMPEIIWHDRDSLLSVDFQAQRDGRVGFYKLVTSSLRKEVRIWKMDFRMLPFGTEDLGVYFVANLVGHRTTVNVARFSPDGHFLVSGDCDGRMIIWKVDLDCPNVGLARDDDFPPNTENWVRYKTPLSHDSDICSLCWSPDSQRFAIVSNDESVAVYEASTGGSQFECEFTSISRRLWHVKSYRRFPNGIAWDPRGKYIVTMSTDRKLDILCEKKGSRLVCIQNVHLPKTALRRTNLAAGDYKLFHDDQLMSFSRIPDFSPDGELLIAPSGILETGSLNIFGTYIFRRSEFPKGRPAAFIPSSKATFRISCSPVLYKLHKQISSNPLKLPYRIVWAALTKDTVYIFDSQLCRCIACATNLQYDTLTDMTWSPDGRVLMICSLEGYISFIRFGEIALGVKYTGKIPQPPPSPLFERERKRRKHKSSLVQLSVKQKRGSSPPNSLLKFFKKMAESQSRKKRDQTICEAVKVSSDISAVENRSDMVKENAPSSSNKSRTLVKRAGDIDSSGKEPNTKDGSKKRAKLTTSPLM